MIAAGSLSVEDGAAGGVATHLRSDHTVGLPRPDLHALDARAPGALEVCGPKGLKAMTEHLLEAYRVDIDMVGRYSGHVVIDRDLDVF